MISAYPWLTLCFVHLLPLLPLLQVFITPMPLLRVMAACGMPHLKNLDEAVNIMREAMLGVIQVCRGRPCTSGAWGVMEAIGSSSMGRLGAEKCMRDTPCTMHVLSVLMTASH